MSIYNYSNRNSYNSNCDCNYTQVCSPDKIDSSCSLNSIRKTFMEIINAVKNELLLGFNVDVEITTNDGTRNVINFSKITINSIEVNKTTLISQGLAISLCDIVKITILTSDTIGSSFNVNLLNSIKNIATTCVDASDYYSTTDDCNSCNINSNVKCAQGIQNYINQNINTIDTISYNGNSPNSQDVELVKEISTTDVLKSSLLNTTSSLVLNDADLETTTTSINQITPTNVDVVSTITTKNTPVITSVEPSNIDVSAPIEVNPTNVISEIDLTEDTSIITKIDSTTKNVVNQVNSTTGTVVTGFTEESSITGVVSNLNTVKTVQPSAVQIPSILSNGTGELKVTIKAKSIDGTNPVSDIVLNVTVNNQLISFNGNTSKYVLSDNINLLGGHTSSPAVSTVKQIGTPTTDTFTKTVSSTNINVLDTVTPSSVQAKLVNSATSAQINNVENPTTQSVVQTVNTQNQNISSITSLNSVKPSSLLSITKEDVLDSASLSKSTTNVLTSSTLENVTTPAVNNINTSLETVFVPTKESIDGKVFAAGDGIMGVNNSNGNITVYSICDINTVNTDTN